jgi:hypothetical protein
MKPMIKSDHRALVEGGGAPARQGEFGNKDMRTYIEDES